MKNLSIRKKLMGGFAVILVLMLIVSCVSISSLGNADDELHHYADGPSVAQQELYKAALSVNLGARAVRDMFINGDTRSVSSYESTVSSELQKIATSIQVVRESGALSEADIATYENAVNAWAVVGGQVIEQFKSGDIEGAQYKLVNECTPDLVKIGTIREELTNKIAELQDVTLQSSAARNTVASTMSASLLIIAVLAGIGIMLRLSKDILTPIDEIGKSMDALSDGNLTYKNNFYSNDEFGQLCEVVRSTTVNLDSYISEIDRAMKELSNGNFDIKAEFEFKGDFKNIQTSILDMVSVMNGTLSQIGIVSEQVSIGSNQVAVGAQTLAQGSTEQASTVEELSDAIESVSKEINANSENATLASKIATDMGREIEVSNEQMQSTVNAMQDINAKSNEMIKIVKIIDDIAFQTNILALNAAVEAARAGVAGKGFAVVADEVRNLASKSSEAAKNITVLIGDSIQSINQGNDVATKAAEALEGVVKNAEEVIIKIDDIANASRLQSEATEKINEGINQISSVVQSISATAEESAAASEELAGQSTSLNNLLSNFTLGAAAKGSTAKPKAKKAKQQSSYDDFDNDSYDDYNDKY